MLKTIVLVSIALAAVLGVWNYTTQQERDGFLTPRNKRMIRIVFGSFVAVFLTAVLLSYFSFKII